MNVRFRGNARLSPSGAARNFDVPELTAAVSFRRKVNPADCGMVLRRDHRSD
jgi:hypothetical protein